MILRDEHGEVEVRIGDLFEFKGALLAVVCQHMQGDAGGLVRTDDDHGIIVVRLKQGVIEKNGQRFEATEENNNLLFYFTDELVASRVRDHRLMTFDIPEPVQTKAKPVPDSRRAPASKKRTGQNNPTSENLF